ncbi:MAG: YbjN domain-containing protein [Candidatus Nanopelagicales bacterium]|nr:YbjN domain-containing protein [Candidatus Nanopelagicales bacterium]
MIDAVIAWCESSGLDFEISGNTCTVVLPGEHKLRTTCSLVAGEHSLSVNAFVARHPDENADAVHRWLLERNRRLFGIAYAIDQLGDIYLVGRIPVEAVSEQLLDQVLGAVLSEADGSFNIILELGFRSSIEKEWRWRLSRGESTANLAAFEHLRPGQG